MVKFADLLDRKAEDIKQPPQLPAGTYVAMVKKYPETTERSSDKGTFEILRFNMEVVEPYEVDEDALAEFGKVQGIPLRNEFIFNTADDPDAERGRLGSLNRLKAFLSNLGAFEEGMTVQDGLTASVAQSCLVEVRHRPDPNDSERFYTEIGKTYAAG